MRPDFWLDENLEPCTLYYFILSFIPGIYIMTVTARSLYRGLKPHNRMHLKTYLIVMSYSCLILLVEMSIFGTFFQKTGTSLDHILDRFSSTGYLVTAICAVAVLILLHLLLKNFSIYNKVKMTLNGIWEGVLSLRGVKNLPLYLFFSIGIWVCYFLHYYLTFFCFDFTSHLGIGCALVSFVVANFAVIVPTPNGAGPWHFAIKTMLILYGVADEQALWFVLIVHTVQTMLVIALGIYAWAALSFTNRITNK